MADIRTKKPQGFRITTLGYIFATLALVLVVLALSTIYAIGTWHHQVVTLEEKYIACNEDGINLQDASDYLTSQGRMFVETGETQYLDNYLTEEMTTQRREAAVADLDTYFNGTSILDALKDALDESNQLTQTEHRAFKLECLALGMSEADMPKAIADVQLSDEEIAMDPAEQAKLAVSLMYSDDYQDSKSRIYASVDDSLTSMTDEINAEQDEVNAVINRHLNVLVVELIALLLTIMIILAIQFGSLLRPLNRFVEHINDHRELPRGGVAEVDYVAANYNEVFRQNQKTLDTLRKEVEETNRLYLEKVEQERDSALHADQSKTAFLFSMSHDIRTPMNAIIGYTNLLKQDPDPETRASYLAKIEDASDILLRLINNVLEMARIESGNVDLDEQPVDLGKMVRSILTVFEGEMQKHHLTAVNEIDIDMPFVYCDATKCGEIAMNIISNAIKYTPDGGTIHSTLRITPAEPGTLAHGMTTDGLVDEAGQPIKVVNLEMIVADTGIGISEDFLPHVFDSFSREKTHTDTKIAGTGLGMGIVKRIVDAMNGTITIESALGKGTTVTVVLPLRVAPEPKAIEETSSLTDDSSFEGKRVLLAEDNDLNAEIGMEVLKEMGLEVVRAADGVICVHLLDIADPGYYDAILMDVQMPNMDGLNATRMIRKMSDPTKAGIPIIAMTANAFEEDRRTTKAAGMDGFVPKPFDVAQLAEALTSVLK